MVTIKDISKKCGVSAATVSKALNGYGDVGEETKKIIIKTAQEMNYFPNAAARTLKKGHSNNIGIIFQDETDEQGGLTHEYFSVILNNAKIEAESSGYDITFINKNVQGSFLEHARYRNFDGVLAVTAVFQSPELSELVKSGFPLVSIDYNYDSHTCIVSDNVIGLYEMTQYFISMGHRKIAFIHGEDTSVTQKRISGFYRALNEANIEVPDYFVKEACYHDPASTERRTEELLKLHDRPTAIIFPDDIAYLGGLTAIGKRQLRVPDDISVAGYDGIKLSQLMQPQLCTYHQDAERIGRIGMRKLIEQIEDPKIWVPEMIKVTGSLWTGETVKNLN